MSEIPEDIMNAAIDAWPQHPRDPLSIEEALKSMALAILAERERCAFLCELRMYDFGCIAGNESHDFVTLCAELADAIRKGEGGATAAMNPAPVITINQPDEDRPASGEGENLHV